MPIDEVDSEAACAATRQAVVDGRPPFAAEGAVPLQEAVDNAVDRNSALRLLGFCDGLQHGQLEVVAAVRNSREDGQQVAAQILDRHDRPTAILTISDAMALGVLDALHQRGLTAGREVSLVGFDDIAAARDAALTTVRQPVYEKGRLAGLKLLERDTLPDQRVTLPTELVARASTGPVSS